MKHALRLIQINDGGGLNDDGELKLRNPLTFSSAARFFMGYHDQKSHWFLLWSESQEVSAGHSFTTFPDVWRSLELDLPVTRFYAPNHVYQIMKKIHEFDSSLREAFESVAHERGVYFIP